MPSPFPGMDPYLESSIPMTVHTQLSAEIARQLAPQVCPQFLALASERLVPEMGGKVPHVSVEIRERVTRQIITAVEVLTPTTKRGRGRDEYLLKRRRILTSTANLLEIDLVIEGERVPFSHPLPPASYFVILSRVEERAICEVWPIPLQQPLPAVPVPLRRGAVDAKLDLQLAFTTIYDVCGFDRAVDYSQPPKVSLTPEDAAWVEDRLRTAGLRP